MKTFQQIEEEIVAIMVAKTDKITLFSVGSAVRGFITAVALKIRDLWYETIQIKRKLFLNTVTGIDLDVYAEQYNLTRKAATKSGVFLVFTGNSGTTIPEGTVVTNPTSNIGFVTKEAITLGATNVNFITGGKYNIENVSIADAAWAESINTGKANSVPADSITKINITGVSVTNPAQAQGGTDVETDDEFKNRIRSYIKLLDMNTQAYYETKILTLDDRVLRAKVLKNYDEPDALRIIIVTKSGVPFTTVELANLNSLIETEQRSFTKITCENIVFTLISISMRVTLKSVNNAIVSFDKYYTDMADIMAKYFDWSKWEWGAKIPIDEVFSTAQTIPQTDEIDLGSFKINNSNTSIILSENSLPYFQAISVTNTTNSEPLEKKNENIIQRYMEPQYSNNYGI